MLGTIMLKPVLASFLRKSAEEAIVVGVAAGATAYALKSQLEPLLRRKK